MTIEPMNPNTVEMVATLEEQCFSTPWSLKDLVSELDNPWAIWITATENGVLAGYLGIQYGPDGADIMSIATSQDFRGKGVAKLLLSHMEQQLKAKNLQWITLEVRPLQYIRTGVVCISGLPSGGTQTEILSETHRRRTASDKIL